MTKKKSDGLASVLQIFCIGLMFLAFYGLSKHRQTNSLLVPLSVFALLTGVIFEGRRLTEKWSSVFYISLASFVFSLICFLPGKQEHTYIFDNHVAAWPYCFLVTFALIAVIVYKDKVTPRLTEGITLLQSIALIYWLIDQKVFEWTGWFIYIITILVSVFTLVSLFNAFTHFHLSRTNRLLLSLWSSVIMLVFAIDNIYKTFQNRAIEEASNLDEKMVIFVEYFLLGVSSIYLLQNFIMLMSFLPGRGTFFNYQYFRDVRELKDDHIDRYSEDQVKIFHSFLVLVIVGTAFYFNFRYDFLPRNLAIWSTFFVIPLLLKVFDSSGRKNYR
jgi:hypothetical protein